MQDAKNKFMVLNAQLEGDKLAKSGKGIAETKAAIERLQMNIK